MLGVRYFFYGKWCLWWNANYFVHSSIFSVDPGLKLSTVPIFREKFHSDRGSQYSSHLLRNQLKAHDFNQSMSGKSNCYDNATFESFFSTLKREMLPDCGYFETREEAKNHIFEHIKGFYNTRRKHSSLGYQSPLEFIKENNQLELTA